MKFIGGGGGGGPAYGWPTLNAFARFKRDFLRVARKTVPIRVEFFHRWPPVLLI
jgi:hypothetical protein